jgi:hypothetical protein
MDALHFGLISIPGVQDVAITEAPNGVPGEIKIEVAYSDPRPEVEEQVISKIDDLRPAGIRVILGEVDRKHVDVRVELTLAGSGLPDAEVTALTRDIETKLCSHLSGLSPEGKARQSKLAALILEDSRVVDVSVILIPQGEAETTDLTLGPGEVLEVGTPFVFPAPAYEDLPGVMPAATATVSALLPIHLVAGVTTADATAAINTAFDGHLASRGPEDSLTVDGLATAIRDDARFALVREDVVVTVETPTGQFQQLADGIGEYTPAENETLQRATVDIEIREGAV